MTDVREICSLFVFLKKKSQLAYWYILFLKYHGKYHQIS